MKTGTSRKFILPPGPILGLSLVGLLLLSALVYYRSVKIQRFLEPALTISQPRMKFAQRINDLLTKEFGATEIRGLKFRYGSIYVDPSLLFESAHRRKGSVPLILKKLGSVLFAALEDPEMRVNISLILVMARIPLLENEERNREMKSSTRDRAVLILNSLYAAEPGLEKNYGHYFAATAIPGNPAMKDVNWIEIRIVPTERLHFDLFQKLEKYTR